MQNLKNFSCQGGFLKKYRLLYKMRQFGLTYKMLRPKESKVRRPTYIKTIKQLGQNLFFNSAHMTTDKQEKRTQKKEKHQRMILLDTMINLHKEFTKQHPNITLSYSSFCTLRPFYVTAPMPSDRKTCQCQYHKNAEMMLKVLREHGIVQGRKLNDSFCACLLLSSK